MTSLGDGGQLLGHMAMAVDAELLHAAVAVALGFAIAFSADWSW